MGTNEPLTVSQAAPPMETRPHYRCRAMGVLVCTRKKRHRGDHAAHDTATGALLRTWPR